jgi:ribonucleoside-diphosphate reductase alpha chain
MAKEGSTVSGLMDTIATMTSIALQYGVPLRTLVDKFSHTRFEPSGFTNNRQIPIAKSVMDYVFRYLGNRFLQPEENEAAEGVPWDARIPGGEEGSEGGVEPRVAVAGGATPYAIVNQADAPSCPVCGSIMIRSGTCYKCPNCATTSGCS